MRKYDSEHHSQNLAWSKLTTITTFDRGKSESRRGKKENALVVARGASATWSILVESLIDQLCKLTERDPVTQKILYNLICKKLCKMKLIDKTYKIEEYQFMRTYYQRALQKLLSISCSHTIDTKLETYLNQSPTALSLSPSIASVSSWSRYQSEFEEIEFIARGGFGHVFRVRNKVDEREYAIKKIYLRYRNENHFVRSLSEVRTLASLDHPNIVAYKAAWFEPFSDVVVEAASSSDSSSPKISPGLYTSKSDSSVFGQESRGIEEDSSNIIFTDRVEETSKSRENNPLPLKSSSLNDTWTSKIQKGDTKERVTSISQSYYRKISKYSIKNSKKSVQESNSSSNAYTEKKLISHQRAYEYAVLHIQMQLCKESLREWLDSRNERLQYKNMETFPSKSESDMPTEPQQSSQLKLDGESIHKALHIFLEILNGVEYVHAKRIIHHDLKPSNIFVEGYEYSPKDNGSKKANEGVENGLNHLEKNRWSQVRVGDFGLACHLSHQMSSDVENVEPKDKKLYVIPTDMVDKMRSHKKMGGHAQGEEKVKEVIGTKLYAAPEQLEGHCNIQSDMFSLGIILFELLHPFFTSMERSKTLSALRSGTIPTHFELQYPNLVHLVRNLLSQNPIHRPSTKELIESIKIYIKGFKEHPDCPDKEHPDLKRDMFDDNSSLHKDVILVKETKTVCVSRSESQITRELHEISDETWKEPLSEGVNFITYACGSPTCYTVRENQEKTISSLIEKNLEKDEIILKLRQQISELQNSRSVVTTIDNN